jgi:hypothetical protein
MSNGGGSNEHGENFLLFVLVGGLVLAGALYGLFLFWPYFVFYFLPFIAGSVIVGFVFWITVVPPEGGEARYQYKRLAIVYPVLIALALLVFEVGSERKIMIDSKGKEKGQVIEWLSVHRTFNEWRSSSYAGSPFTGLKAKAKSEELYDRRQMGAIFWWCLFLGGPLMFFWLSRKAHELEEDEIEKRVEARTGERRRRLDKMSEDIDAVIASKTKKLVDEVAQLKSERAAIMAQNQVLKATVEFSTEIVRPSETVKTRGVLDQDIL